MVLFTAIVTAAWQLAQKGQKYNYTFILFPPSTIHYTENASPPPTSLYTPLSLVPTTNTHTYLTLPLHMRNIPPQKRTSL